jgi:hypothetical protein
MPSIFTDHISTWQAKTHVTRVPSSPGSIQKGTGNFLKSSLSPFYVKLEVSKKNKGGRLAALS